MDDARAGNVQRAGDAKPNTCEKRAAPKELTIVATTAVAPAVAAMVPPFRVTVPALIEKLPAIVSVCAETVRLG